MKHTQTEYTTINLTGQIFSGDMLTTLAQGKEEKYQSAADYKLLPGIRFADEISRSFHIAQALYEEFESHKTDGTDAYKATSEFVLKFLSLCLGYVSYRETKGDERVIGTTTYPVEYFAAENVPLVIAPYSFTLEQTDGRFTTVKEGVNRKKSAFTLAQLYLNASKPCVWAIACNGNEIRLLRDSDSMVRPQYLAFDLQQIFEGKKYPDFAALWYMMHSSRTEIWEKWRVDGVNQGSRVRDKLSDGVTFALLYLGAGFLKTSGKGNTALRDALQNGKKTDGTFYSQQDFYHELLRVIYRFLFLSTLEERNLIFAHNEEEVELTTEQTLAHKIYNEGYSIHRLALRSRKNISNDRYTDLWQGIRIVFKSLQKGNEKLDLAALGGLFKADQCPMVDECEIDNTHLLRAIKCLRWCYIDKTLTFTDYRNMDTEEFGSVYESLLELVPSVNLESNTFAFIGIGDESGVDEEGSTTGNVRKLTGSYYTNSELVQKLIDNALIPAVNSKIEREQRAAEHIKQEYSEEKTLLSMTVIDPACGSGHFLLAAARYIAQRLAEIRQEKNPDEAKGDLQYRKALRDVVSNCIYGVDMNPMAVELARTALWLEGYEPGKPLGFLDHHIKCGNSLVGVYDMSILENGIPDAAYEPLSGDDSNTAKTAKKANKDQIARKEMLRNQGTFDFGDTDPNKADDYTKILTQISFMKADTLSDVEAKEKKYNELLKSKDYLKRKTACDLYTAAFFAKKTTDSNCLIPDSECLFAALDEENEPIGKEGTRALANKLSEQNKFFHWCLEFPEVIQNKKGFDCVLANPPWNRVKLMEDKYFATREPEIADDKLNKAQRERKIEALRNGNEYQKELYQQYIEAKRDADATSKFVHFKDNPDCRYPLTGTGDVNLYALFAELILWLTGTKKEDEVGNGTAGFIVQSGIATDDTTKKYFETIVTKGLLSSLYDFENTERLFPIHRSYKISLITLNSKHTTTDLAFFLHNIPELKDSRRHFILQQEDFTLINPNTRTCPTFRSKKDAELAKKIYKRSGVFINEKDEENGNPWNLSFLRMFDMSLDSDLFRDKPGKDADGSELLPLYEGKLFHQYDQHWATYIGNKEPDELTLSQKQNKTFKVTAKAWVSKKETVLRATKLNSSVLKALVSCLKNPDSKNELQKLYEVCNNCPDKAIKELTKDLKYDKSVIDKLYKMAEEQTPEYFMAWRNICRPTDTRTIIASILPFCALGNSAAAAFFNKKEDPKLICCLLANMNSIVLECMARMKIGGSNLNFFIVKQLPILSPKVFTENAMNFIVPRVFYLTYTANDVIPWAKALWNSCTLDLRLKIINFAFEETAGIKDTKFVDREFSDAMFPPVVYEKAKRMQVESEIDAYYAKLYGISRTDLEYILDPKNTEGEEYPSVTFPSLRDNEIREYGEYRTQRLVLEAWDKLDY